ncbi:hypothetical protein [Sinomonas sp. R1AF57]|uniref:hypothetical protein n=1 Tax=Sinomonas sp. R1AF57 TaxID=2020377 RepID=UPI000B60938E|nr:hypothetical protein [Sinomonas sp. R1AF57]ASN52499.1 hypothetical protein CGQ25_10780 [Sinomonas sp. R1AF57]
MEDKATLTAAAGRAAAWAATAATTLQTAKDSLRSTLRAAFIAGTTPTQATVDTQADAVNRAQAELNAANALVSELNAQVNFA